MSMTSLFVKVPGVFNAFLTMDGYGSINVKDILPYILAPYTGILCLTLF
jgi:hypothetical protein